MAKTSACALSGFVPVKKVPGSLNFLSKSPGQSFDYQAIGSCVRALQTLIP